MGLPGGNKVWLIGGVAALLLYGARKMGASPGLRPNGRPFGPMGRAGSTSLSDLHPQFKPRAEEWLRRVEGAGIKVKIIATLRTPAIQDALYAQGREPLPDVNAKRVAAGLDPLPSPEKDPSVVNRITEAQGSDPSKWSWHLVGFAFDYCTLTSKGKCNYNWTMESGPPREWTEAGRIGKEMGFVWGGDWSIRDYAHLEWHPWTTRTAPNTDLVKVYQAGKLPTWRYA